ncbi:MAG: glycosyltransferase family 4 protein [Saprospiraceae bacterium]|nr:glycosyltransferase family 4 protein [Candidatus Brachybacter algidus]
MVHPTHYHDYFFNELAKDTSIVFSVYYLSGLLSSYPWKTNFRSGYSSTLSRSFMGVDKNLLNEILKNEKKLVIITGWENPVKIITSIFCFLTKTPFVIWTDTPNLQKRRIGLKAKLRDLWLSFLFKKSFLFFSTGNVGVSNLVQMGISRSKVRDFPFFVDLNFFKPNSDNSRLTSTIFSSGRLDIAHKGYDIALKALYHFKISSDVSFDYLIAGTGPDESIIRELGSSLNLEENVTFLGWCEPDQILNYYQNCRIFLHSSHFDPFPNAILEAMACGCLVIASSAAGSAKDRIEHGINGFIFEDGNVEELKKCLIWALSPDNNHKIFEMGIAARQTALSYPAIMGVNLLKKLISYNGC